MKRLKVLGPYNGFEVGAIISLDDAQADWYLRDSPGSFEVVTEAKAEEAPPKDKAVKRAPRKKVVKDE